MRGLQSRCLFVVALLAVPALAWNGEDFADLRERLSRTVSSIVEFKRLEESAAARDTNAITQLIAVTEPGPADNVQAEILLAELRARVSALQEILDARALENGQEPSATRIEETRPVPVTEPARTNSSVEVAEHAPTPASTPSARDAGKVAFEAADFVADRSRLGRACWRGGRYQEGVAVLEPLAGEPQSDYWRARCLEKLARNTEACTLYRHVIEVAGTSPEGRSAREDLEFLEWSMLHGVKP